MSLDEDIRLGDRAQSLLGDEVLKLAISNIEHEQMEAWRNSPARDTEGREKIWASLQQLGLIRKELERMAAGSISAKAMIEAENKQRETSIRVKNEIAGQLGIDPKYIED